MSPSADAAASSRKAITDERWTEMEMEEEQWPMQRVYYEPRLRRERPRYRSMTDVEADEKSEFVVPTRRPAVDAAGAEAAYAQRNEPPTHFVARRRVRRYPDHARWAPRSYPTQMREAGYPMYAVPSPHGKEQGQQISRTRPRHIYQEQRQTTLHRQSTVRMSTAMKERRMAKISLRTTKLWISRTRMLARTTRLSL